MMPRILILEDESSLAKAVSERLQHHGYVTTVCASLFEANKYLAAHTPDMMILESRLPDGDGLELLRRGTPQSVRIIVLAPSKDSSDRVEALDAGADDCLTRPFPIGEIVARVRAVLRR